MKNVGNVPKLRFPEFWEHWRDNNLGTISDSISSGKDKNDPDGKYDLYGSTGVIGKTSNDTYKGKFLLVARVGANAGLLTVTNGIFGVTDNTLVVCLKKIVNLDFIYYYLESLSLNKLVFGSGQPLITGGQLKALHLFLPDHPEQQKIADCLSSIADRITAETQKLDTLKAHKKGLMQHLFPAEGETLPKLRFPEFQDAGEWQEQQIGDLKPFVTSGSRGWAAFYADQGSLFIRITNLSRASIYLDLTDSKFVKLPPENTEGVRTQLKANDVLISITADIGIIGYVDASIPSPAYINQHIALVRFDDSRVWGQFVSYFLASERSQRLFCASTDIGTKAGMSLISVQKIQIVLPSLSEQQKIADCLSSIDEAITSQSQAIDLLKVHKKGLMQQLFPSIEEVQE